MVTLNSSSQSITSEEVLYYAQLVAEAFVKPFEQAQCAVSIPMAVYIDIQRRKDEIDDISDSINDDPNDDWNDNNNPDDISTYNPIDQNKSKLASDIAKSLYEKCISCDIGLPKFNLDGALGDAVAKMKSYLDDLKRQFKFQLPNPMQLAFIFSYLCIPDLLRLLALILSIIAKIISGFSLLSFSITVFIMGIIGAILKVLFKYVSAMVSVSMSPVMCILNAVTDILDQLPTPNNIRRSITDEESQVLGISKSTTPDVVDKLRSKIEGIQSRESSSGQGSIEATMNDALSDIQDIVNDAISSLQDTVDDLLSIKTYFECESERSGPTIGQQIERILQLMQIVNLIRAVISKKSGKKALEKMNQEYRKDISGMYENSYLQNNYVVNSSDSLSLDEVGEAVSDALGKVVDLVKDPNGNTVGILIQDKEKIATIPRLDLFSCNLKDFIDDSGIDDIVDDTIDDILDNNGTKGKPGTISILDLLPTDRVSLVNTDDVDLTSKTINDVLDMLGYIDKNTSKGGGGIGDSIGTKPTNNTNNNGSGNQSSVSSFTSSQLPHTNTNGTISNIALKCGSIESILSTIDSLKRNEDI